MKGKPTVHKGKDKDKKNDDVITAKIFKIGDNVKLTITEKTAAEATVFGIRFSKNKVHYDLNVKSDKGVIPFYNIDSVLIK